jgi:hypothetical protein
MSEDCWVLLYNKKERGITEDYSQIKSNPQKLVSSISLWIER